MSIASFYSLCAITASNIDPRCRNKLTVIFSRGPINSPSSSSLSNVITTERPLYPLPVDASPELKFIAEGSNSLRPRYVYKCAPLIRVVEVRPFFSNIKQCKIHSVSRRAAAKASRRRRRRAPSHSAVMYSRFPSHSFFIAVTRRIRISRRENLTHTYATASQHAKTYPTALAHGGICYEEENGWVEEGEHCKFALRVASGETGARVFSSIRRRPRRRLPLGRRRHRLCPPPAPPPPPLEPLTLSNLNTSLS